MAVTEKATWNVEIISYSTNFFSSFSYLFASLPYNIELLVL